MTNPSAVISNNIAILLKKNGKKQNDLANLLGVSKQIVSNMINGSRMINAVELHRIADFFNVTMESLMEAPDGIQDSNAIHAFMGEVNTPEARDSLAVADEIADMIIFYANVSNNMKKMMEPWEG